MERKVGIFVPYETGRLVSFMRLIGKAANIALLKIGYYLITGAKKKAEPTKAPVVNPNLSKYYASLNLNY